MSLDLSRLPREKLIALLQDSLKRAEHAELAAEESQKRAEHAELVAEESQKRADRAEQAAEVARVRASEIALKLDISEKKYAAAAVFLGEVAPLIHGMRFDAERRLGADPVENRKLFEDLRECIRKLVVEANNVEKFKELAFGKGGEKLNPELAELKKNQASIKEDLEFLQQGIRQATKAQAVIDELQREQDRALCGKLAEPAEEPVDPMARIANARRGKRPASGKNEPKRRGRQPSRSDLPVVHRDPDAAGSNCCPTCRHETKDLGTQVAELVELACSLKDRYEKSRNTITLRYCEKCGTVHPIFPKNMQFPVKPEHTLSMNCLSEAAMHLNNGLPLNRVEVMMLSRLKLGSNTLFENLCDWSDIYLGPLMRRITEACRDRVFLVDETPYHVLEGEARGAYADRQKTSSQTYVLSVGTKTKSSTPFVWFAGLGSRKAEDIGRLLQDMHLNMEVLVTDGYAGYDALSNTVFSGIRRQSCLVHARREVYGAVTNRQFLAELNKLPKQDRAERMHAHARARTVEARLLAIISGYSLLFQYEQEVAERLDGESDAEHEARILKHRREHSSPIFAAMDEIYMELSRTLTKEKNGRYVKAIETPAASAVVYWMNHRENLGQFLKDGRIPLETNTVERSIRPVAMLRKNQNFMQTLDGMNTVATCLSVTETAKLNGIDMMAWLNDYCSAAYRYAYAKGWTQAYRAGKDPNRKIQKWDMKALLKDFDLTPWLPWEWKKRQAIG